MDDVITLVGLIPEEATAMITDFATDIVPTVMQLLVILVPAGLTLWAIGFAVNRGLGYLKRNASI